MSRKSKRTFSLWFLFILCVVPAIFLTPMMLNGDLELSRLTVLHFVFVIASAVFLIAAVLSSVSAKSARKPAKAPTESRSYDPERRK